MGFFNKLKEKLGSSASESAGEIEEAGYVELDSDSAMRNKARFIVRPFVLEEFDNVKPILDAIREGSTIALVNIKPLKDKDLIELKRAINKLKKTCDAIEGDIAGFGENWIAAVPSFAYIHRGKPATSSEAKQEESNVAVDEVDE